MNTLTQVAAEFKCETGLNPPKKLDFPSIAKKVLLRTFADFQAAVLRDNPALMSIDYNYRSLWYKSKATFSLFYPHLDLDAIAEHNDKLSGVDQKKNHFQILLVASWNLFNGFSDQTNRKIALSKQTIAALKRRALYLDLNKECRVDWKRYTQARRQVQQLQVLVNKLALVYRDYQAQFSVYNGM